MGPAVSGPSRDRAKRPPSASLLRRAEYALIGACMAIADVRRLTAGRLHAEDFAASEVSATWLAISGLERRGEPVDFVLVAAEVERQGDTPRFGHGRKR